MNRISRFDESKLLDSILKESAEFGSQEELDKYLKDHPKADPKKHKVVEKKKIDKSDLSKKIKEKKKQLSTKEIDNMGSKLNDMLNEDPELEKIFDMSKEEGYKALHDLAVKNFGDKAKNISEKDLWQSMIKYEPGGGNGDEDEDSFGF